NYWATRLQNLPNVRFHTSFDADQSCGIALVEIPGVDPEAISRYLMEKHKIFTVAINHEEFKGNRITPNVYTTTKELDRFCEVMETIARKGIP
ncbi:MAG: aminotransferase, partial [Bacteroidetes bacterium]|nr:aminotransferase [Bacteroidota bacterium]